MPRPGHLPGGGGQRVHGVVFGGHVDPARRHQRPTVELAIQRGRGPGPGRGVHRARRCGHAAARRVAVVHGPGVRAGGRVWAGQGAGAGGGAGVGGGGGSRRGRSARRHPCRGGQATEPSGRPHRQAATHRQRLATAQPAQPGSAASPPVWQPEFASGGTSRAGLRSKNPNGLSQNDTVSTGMIGQSSGRVMWWIPNTYHSTTSVFSIGRFRAVQTGSPVSAALWVGKSPHGHRSSGWYGVTQSVCSITPARRSTADDRSSSAGNDPPGTSLYPAWVPSEFEVSVLTTFQPRWVGQS